MKGVIMLLLQLGLFIVLMIVFLPIGVIAEIGFFVYDWMKDRKNNEDEEYLDKVEGAI